MSKTTQGITVKKSENISEWYVQVLQKAELIEYTDVSGCIIYRPRLYAMWEEIKKWFDEEIKKLGVENAYFPLFIPKRLLEKEAEHVQGFAPEVAWVMRGGRSELKEEIAVRPTSETVIYDAYAKWIQSHRDLPIKINQWVNVVRWEFKHPTPLIRGREFLWQEGHTAFATKKEAEEEVQIILELYRRVFEELLAVPVIKGIKAPSEKFAGADYSTSVETLTPSGKAVQAATSHHLGQNFAKAFEIEYQDESGKKANPYQNSWGISTRSLGAMILYHSDDKGLVVPPRVAPLHAVVIPITFDKNKNKVLREAKKITKTLEEEGVKVLLDDRDHYTPGWKFNEWELKGACIRIELGPKDLEKEQAIAVRRDTGKKTPVKLNELSKKIPKMLDKMQKDLLSSAKEWLDSQSVEAKSWAEFQKAAKEKKLIWAQFCTKDACASSIHEESGAKSLNLPYSAKKPKGNCIKCKNKSKAVGIFAKSY